MNTDFDAVIIGGGPAGASTALLLARAGWSVAIIEKKKFPRTKVCGEFISATSLPLMQKLGILDFYQQHAGPPIQRVGWFTATNMLTAAMPSADNALGPWGRALGREQLDSFLLQQAQSAGAIVWQPWNVQNLIDKGSHFSCQITTKDQSLEINARIVIMAQGSWEQPVIRAQNSGHKKSDLLAFKTHFNDSSLENDLMALITFPGGYGGLVHNTAQQITLSCCIRRDQLHTIRKQNLKTPASEAVFRYILSTCTGAARVLAKAHRADTWLSIGPLRPGIRHCYHEGVFYVGNIAGEAHPIIAEGISMAMQSGWLLAQSLLSQTAISRQDLAQIGKKYTQKWKAQFASRIHAAAIFAQITTRPRAMSLLTPIVKQFPGLLTYGASLSGKAKAII